MAQPANAMPTFEESILTAADALAYSIHRSGLEDGLVGKMETPCLPCPLCVEKAIVLERLIEGYRFRGLNRTMGGLMRTQPTSAMPAAPLLVF